MQNNITFTCDPLLPYNILRFGKIWMLKGAVVTITQHYVTLSQQQQLIIKNIVHICGQYTGLFLDGASSFVADLNAVRNDVSSFQIRGCMLRLSHYAMSKSQTNVLDCSILLLYIRFSFPMLVNMQITTLSSWCLPIRSTSALQAPHSHPFHPHIQPSYHQQGHSINCSTDCKKLILWYMVHWLDVIL